MISGVAGVSSPYPVDYARPAAQAGKTFAIPESALRTGGSAQPGDTMEISGVARALSRRMGEVRAADEAAGGYENPMAPPSDLSQEMAQYLVNNAYAPPLDQRIQFPSTPAAPGDERTDGSESGEDGSPGAAEAPLENEEGGGGDVEEPSDPEAGKGADGQPLNEQEQAQVRELKTRDREVRAHEQAHMAVGGSYAGAASYEYQQGPDGGRYAVGGEVSIDMSPEREPEATIAKMQVVKAAAMAPAEPSPQDHSVAAQAGQNEARARQEISRQRTEEAAGAGRSGESENGESGTSGESDAAAGAAEASGTAAANASGASSSAVNAAGGNNQFTRRYAENAYASANNAPRLPISSSIPVNIVA